MATPREIHLQASSDVMYQLQQTGQFCNVTLLVGDHGNDSVKAHSVVLASASNYFATMFKTLDHPSDQKYVIRLLQTQKETLERILCFIYTGQLSISSDTVEDLLNLSKALEVTCAVDLCTSFIEANKPVFTDCALGIPVTDSSNLSGGVIQNSVEYEERTLHNSIDTLLPVTECETSTNVTCSERQAGADLTGHETEHLHSDSGQVFHGNETLKENLNVAETITNIGLEGNNDLSGDTNEAEFSLGHMGVLLKAVETQSKLSPLGLCPSQYAEGTANNQNSANTIFTDPSTKTRHEVTSNKGSDQISHGGPAVYPKSTAKVQEASRVDPLKETESTVIQNGDINETRNSKESDTLEVKSFKPGSVGGGADVENQSTSKEQERDGEESEDVASDLASAATHREETIEDRCKTKEMTREGFETEKARGDSGKPEKTAEHGRSKDKTKKSNEPNCVDVDDVRTENTNCEKSGSKDTPKPKRRGRPPKVKNADVSKEDFVRKSPTQDIREARVTSSPYGLRRSRKLKLDKDFITTDSLFNKKQKLCSEMEENSTSPRGKIMKHSPKKQPETTVSSTREAAHTDHEVIIKDRLKGSDNEKQTVSISGLGIMTETPALKVKPISHIVDDFNNSSYREGTSGIEFITNVESPNKEPKEKQLEQNATSHWTVSRTESNATLLEAGDELHSTKGESANNPEDGADGSVDQPDESRDQTGESTDQTGESRDQTGESKDQTEESKDQGSGSGQTENVEMGHVKEEQDEASDDGDGSGGSRVSVYKTCRLDGKSKNNCVHCGKRFSTQKELKHHVKVYHFEMKKSLPHSCQKCGYVAQSEKNLHIHMKHKHYVPFDKKKFEVITCQIKGCQYETLYASSMDKHKKMHEGLRPYVCEVCNKAFKQKPALSSHLLIHEGLRPHRCDICGQSFRQESTFKMHLKRKHGNPDDPKKFSCPQCSFSTMDSANLTFHLFRKHNVELPERYSKFQCEFCSMILLRKTSYDAHIRRHKDERPFVCDICDKRFITESELRYHKRWHGERNHQCSQCSYATVSQFKLAEHMRLIHTHKGETPYPCHLCSYKTAVKGNLTKHLRAVHKVEVKSNQIRIPRIHMAQEATVKSDGVVKERQTSLLTGLTTEAVPLTEADEGHFQVKVLEVPGLQSPQVLQLPEGLVMPIGGTLHLVKMESSTGDSNTQQLIIMEGADDITTPVKEVTEGDNIQYTVELPASSTMEVTEQVGD